MKILHTADWHIGKKLHSYLLDDDFNRFIDWLCRYLQKGAIDVLLVSGDVFDLANPSADARHQYYESLVKLKKSVNHIILTGGNHDSPAMLNAPKELLKALNFDVVGGLPAKIEDALIPLKNKQGETEVVVAAIPFLRHPDIRTSQEVIKTYEDRLEAMRQGIKAVFQRAAEACKTIYPGVPAVAMGHLFAAGMETSDSERDIQIGNQAAFQAGAFDAYFEYVALGHIHKPQRVSSTQPVYYSGSPLSLSFRERQDKKRVLIIDTEKGWTPQSVPVPVFRKLIKITGTLTDLQAKLAELPPHQGLQSLIELELHETEYQAKYLQNLEDLVTDFNHPGYEIVKQRIHFDKALHDTGEVFEEQVGLEELKPQKVFEELLAQNDFSAEEHAHIKAAFLEILEDTP